MEYLLTYRSTIEPSGVNEEADMFDLLNDLQLPIFNADVDGQRVENERSTNSHVKETSSQFEDLMFEARNPLY